MGREELLSQKAKSTIAKSDIIFGAKRILDSVTSIPDFSDLKSKELYRREDIFAFLSEKPEYNQVSVLFSGDTGFFSGARAFFSEFSEKTNDWQLEIINGLSSPVYFASKIHKSWQNWKMLPFTAQNAI